MEGAVKRKGGEFRKRRRKEGGRKKKKKKRKCKKSARSRWWTKIGKSVVCAFTRKGKEEEEEKKCRGEVRYTKAGQSMSGVSAAAEGSQRGAAVVFRMRGEMQFKEERQTESVYRWKQPKGVLNGPA